MRGKKDVYERTWYDCFYLCQFIDEEVLKNCLARADGQINSAVCVRSIACTPLHSWALHTYCCGPFGASVISN